MGWGSSGSEALPALPIMGCHCTAAVCPPSTVPPSCSNFLLPSPPPQSFEDLGLSRPLLKACQALGYAHPTPIQVGRAGMAGAVRLLARAWGGSGMPCTTFAIG